jgi:hypothetical protein
MKEAWYEVIIYKADLPSYEETWAVEIALVERRTER